MFVLIKIMHILFIGNSCCCPCTPGLFGKEMIEPEQHLSEMQAIYRFAEVTGEQRLGVRKKEMAERKKTRNLKHVIRFAREQTHKFVGKGTLRETNGDFDEGGDNGSFPSCLMHGISTFASRCRGSPGLCPPFLLAAT